MEPEWRGYLDAFASQVSSEHQPRFVVASGSLPLGVPSDFYAQIARIAKQAGAKMILDTSGPALKEALEAGVYIVKPSLREFSDLMSTPLKSESDWITACRSVIESRRTEIIALSMGEHGALLVTSHQVLRGQAIPIKPVSVVGAGDSFLGAMIWSLACGHPMEHAFRYGIAAGSAALLMPGTEMCRREDVERLVRDVKVQPI
jgi:6-phosphofructokinase 2